MAHAIAEAGSNVTVVVDFLDNSDTGPGGGHIVPLVGATGVGKVIATAMQTLAGGRRRAVATVSSEAFAGFGADATFFVAGARGISNDGLAAADSTQNATVTFVKRPALRAPLVDAAVAFPGMHPVYFEISAQSYGDSQTGFGASNFTGADTGNAEHAPCSGIGAMTNALLEQYCTRAGNEGEAKWEGSIRPHDSNRVTVVTAKVETAALRGAAGEAAVERYTYVLEDTIGEGIHGSVFRATCVETGAKVAIKKIRQKDHVQDAELRNLLAVGHHPNIVRLHQYYFSSHPEGRYLYLNLVLEHMPTQLEAVSLFPSDPDELPYGGQRPGPLPPYTAIYVKLYLHQILAALAHLHRQGIVHRDLSSDQILVDPTSHVIGLCDLGAAKDLAPDGKVLAYSEVAAPEFQAPELIFAPELYWYFTPAIDMWSVGCVMVDLLLGRRLGHRLFHTQHYDDSHENPVFAIYQVLGRPSKQDLRDMEGKGQAAAWRQHFQRFSPFVVKGKKEAPLAEVFRGCPAADAVALDLLERLLVYSPRRRLTAAQALEHPFFDTLRGLEALPDGTPMPPLVGFATDRPEAAAEQ